MQVKAAALKSTLPPLENVQAKVTPLINNLVLANSLQSLSRRRLVADLSKFCAD